MMAGNSMRTCTGCGRAQPLSEFYIRRGRPATRCKTCGRADSRAWYHANRERAKRRIRAWNAVNREHRLAWRRVWSRAYRKTPQYRERATERQRLRQAGIAAATVERVDRLVLMELHDGVCGICGEDVDPFAFHVDHIVPLARGGEHSYANTQPAHPSCNQRKHAKVV